MTPDEFFNHLWQSYSRLNPQAGPVRNALELQGNRVINDHVAFRTWGRSPVSISRLEPLLREMGYRPHEEYHFSEKKLDARSYIHDREDIPLIFFSEIRYWELAPEAAAIAAEIAEKITVPDTPDTSLFSHGRLWPAPDIKQYQQLQAHSEYAAWLSIHGLVPNHFTVAVHYLTTMQSLEEVNQFITCMGYSLNSPDKPIKGSPQQQLEQSSTVAAQIETEFAGGIRKTIPGCFYEFARRYRNTDGQLFRGFIEANANEIFESTHSRTG